MPTPDDPLNHQITEQNTMILALESDFEVLAMDENDYQEPMLFASFDDTVTKQQNDCSYSTVLTEGTSVQTEDDDRGVVDTDEANGVKPSKIASNIAAKIRKIAAETTGDVESTRDAGQAGDGSPGAFDVLCGQSRVCASHAGNKRFQAILDLYAPKYHAVNSKQEKMALTKEIVSRITNSGGRFLKYKVGEWKEISTVTARDKVSHALRTKVASWRRQEDQEQQSESATPSPSRGKRASHRGRRTPRSHRRRWSSSSSLVTSTSDIANNSFDSSDQTSNNLIEDLLKTQREIFASLQKNSEASAGEHPLKRSSSR